MRGSYLSPFSCLINLGTSILSSRQTWNPSTKKAGSLSPMTRFKRICKRSSGSKIDFSPRCCSRSCRSEVQIRPGSATNSFWQNWCLCGPKPHPMRLYLPTTRLWSRSWWKAQRKLRRKNCKKCVMTCSTSQGTVRFRSSTCRGFARTFPRSHPSEKKLFRCWTPTLSAIWGSTAGKHMSLTSKTSRKSSLTLVWRRNLIRFSANSSWLVSPFSVITRYQGVSAQTQNWSKQSQ